MSTADLDSRFLLATYRRLPAEVVRGEGMYLFDREGRAYLDFLGGVAVNALGYGNRDLLAAIQQQAERYIHISNYFLQVPQVELAERLCEVSGFSKVFFCNSGSEASEGAFKILRKWGAFHGRTEIISMTNSFHGRSMGSLSLMSNPEYKDGFGPFLDGCVQVPFNDVSSLEAAVTDKTIGIVLECIQGEGGVVEISSDFAACVSGLQQKHNLLVVADEVQSGVGRTGKFFGFEHFGLQPDIITLAKPLGGGLPLGAILLSEALKDILQPGMHGTTFGGNPVACAAGKVVLHEVLDHGLMRNAAETGAYFSAKLRGIRDKHPTKVLDVRGRGLMLGCGLAFPGKPVADEMLRRGFIINCTHQTVLRFLPPLIVQREQVDELCAALEEVLEEYQP